MIHDRSHRVTNDTHVQEMESDTQHLPEYSLNRFIEFLDYRGVLRKPWVNRSRPSTFQLKLIALPGEIEEEADSILVDDRLFMTEENDIGNFFPQSIESFQVECGTPPSDPDTFYNKTESKDTNEVGADDDSAYRYINQGVAGDRRYSNNSERRPSTLKDTQTIAMTIQKAYNEWERRGMATMRAPSPRKLSTGKEGTDVARNGSSGGLSEPFRLGFSEIVTDSTAVLLQLAAASKYRDLLLLNYLGATMLTGLGASRRYKNNLSVVIHDGKDEDLLLVACASEILMYEFDSQLHKPKETAKFRFDTKPPSTTIADGNLLTWPYYPHTINFMTATDDWQHGPAIGICTDDGSILIWHTSNLRSEMDRLCKENLSPNARLYNLRVKADLNFKLGMSAWGLDFGSATDEKGEKHYILAASSNSQTVTLCYFDRAAGIMNSVDSLELLHNIPEVSIIDYFIFESTHVATVSCASISGELVIFKFTFKLDDSALRQTSEWPERLGRALFSEPVVLRRTKLNSECWTVKPMSTKYFKLVQSLKSMTGDPSIEEDTEITQILIESAILGLSSDPLHSSDLGGAAYFQFFDSPVVCLAVGTEHDPLRNNTSKFGSNEEEYRRIHQAYKSICSSSAPDPLQNFVLAVSTDSKLGLFRADTLFCPSATKKVFTLDLPENEETKWCKRILITHVIKELLCFIAVSQLGLVTIMRLCEHRGLYGMRQEFLFPNALSLSIAENNLRTIIGVAIRDLSIKNEILRYFLYILYSDGLVLTYELRDQKDIGFDIDF